MTISWMEMLLLLFEYSYVLSAVYLYIQHNPMLMFSVNRKGMNLEIERV